LSDKFSREEALETDKFVGVDQPFVYDVEGVKLDQAADETNVCRFFKIGSAPVAK
jgi:hypothetical protein